jgi:hypothetical protein
MIDEKGRCCGVKPLVYKRPTHHLFCCRCDAEYDFPSLEQKNNFAWVKVDGKFEMTPLMKSAKAFRESR